MLFSIIIPTYNSAKICNKALDSIKEQTFKDFEVIIIDDASSDNTIEVINENYSKVFDVKILRNEINMGAGATRQVGIDKANGDYLIFIDADDSLYESTTLEKFKDEILKSYPDVIRSKYREQHEDRYYDKSTREVYSIYGNAYKRKFLMYNDIKMPSFRYMEDCTFNSIINNVTSNQSYIDEVTYLYLDNEDSLCRSYDYIKLSLPWIIKSDMYVFDYFKDRNINIAYTLTTRKQSFNYFYYQGVKSRMTDKEIEEVEILLKESELKTNTLAVLEYHEAFWNWFIEDYQDARQRATWYVKNFIERETFIDFANRIINREWKPIFLK